MELVNLPRRGWSIAVGLAQSARPLDFCKFSPNLVHHILKQPSQVQPSKRRQICVFCATWLCSLEVLARSIYTLFYDSEMDYRVEHFLDYRCLRCYPFSGRKPKEAAKVEGNSLALPYVLWRWSCFIRRWVLHPTSVKNRLWLQQVPGTKIRKDIRQGGSAYRQPY